LIFHAVISELGGFPHIETVDVVNEARRLLGVAVAFFLKGTKGRATLLEITTIFSRFFRYPAQYFISWCLHGTHVHLECTVI
jgi:hypothetical protein